jgi:SLT domain-containing protein
MEVRMSKHATRRKRALHGDTAERNPSGVPDASKAALREAMRLEAIPLTQYQDLLWIMTQESSGKVGARNSHSSARGLFQLLRNNYALNPHGVDSFGNGVEECQGGIRYIVQRYRSAANARVFWQKHHWY